MNTPGEPGAAHCKRNSRQSKRTDREPNSERLLIPTGTFASHTVHSAKASLEGGGGLGWAVEVPKPGGLPRV